MPRRKQSAIQWFLESRIYLVLIWVFIAFTLITLIILFPNKGWIAYVKDKDLGGTVEKIGSILLIMIAAVVAFVISWKMYEWHLSKKKLAVSIASIFIPFVLSIGTLLLLIVPNDDTNLSDNAVSQQRVQPSGEPKKPVERTFETMKSLERGDIYRLADSVYMSPYPTEEELDYFFVRGKWKTVVCLLDKNVKENQYFIDYEKKKLQKTNIQFAQISLNPNAKDKQIEAVAKACLNFQKPLVIHSWFTNKKDNVLFRKKYYEVTNKVPLNLALGTPEAY